MSHYKLDERFCGGYVRSQSGDVWNIKLQESRCRFSMLPRMLDLLPVIIEAKSSSGCRRAGHPDTEIDEHVLEAPKEAI